MKCKKHAHDSDAECPGCASLARMRESAKKMIPQEEKKPPAPPFDQNVIRQINDAFRLYDHRMKKLETPDPPSQRQVLTRIGKAAMVAAFAELVEIYFPKEL